MAATIKDVAMLARVSRATASRVLGGYGYVSEETRVRVLEAAQELRYRPHAIARSMVTGRTGTIGLVVADIENLFFAKVARGVSDAITPENFNLIVCSTNESVREERLAIDGLRQKWVDGLIVAPSADGDRSHITDVVDQGIPLVLVDRVIESIQTDAVAAANSEGAYEAVRHLIRLGHTRIGFIGDCISTTEERLCGYKRALQEAGIEVDGSRVRIGAYSVEGGYRDAVTLLRDGKSVSAVFAASNFAMMGLLMASRDMQVNVPEHLAVIGFDDSEWHELTSPTVTAVAQPVYEVGRVAAQHLLRRIAGYHGRPEVTRLATRLMIRESSGGTISTS